MPTVLPKALDASTLPSSLLLENATLEDALLLAKKLLADRGKVDSGNHPDLHIYQTEGKSDLHPMANMQRIIREMALPPFESKYKVFLIEDAEKMLPASSNALLKTLEEPAEDTYFLLLSHFPDRLLPTILSRLHPITFSREEKVLLDLAPYFALAAKGEWDRVLEHLKELEEKDPEMVLDACLDFAAQTKDPSQFQKMMTLVEQGKKAIQHNVKLTSIFLHILLQE